MLCRGAFGCKVTKLVVTLTRFVSHHDVPWVSLSYLCMASKSHKNNRSSKKLRSWIIQQLCSPLTTAPPARHLCTVHCNTPAWLWAFRFHHICHWQFHCRKNSSRRVFAVPYARRNTLISDTATIRWISIGDIRRYHISQSNRAPLSRHPRIICYQRFLWCSWCEPCNERFEAG